MTYKAAGRWGIPETCRVCAGSSDSIAAFLASGAEAPGMAVSSLGSTLAIKLISKTRVDDSSQGIYSHRLGDVWLVGGASNVGCAVLRKEGFSNDELKVDKQFLEPGERNEPQPSPSLTYALPRSSLPLCSTNRH